MNLMSLFASRSIQDKNELYFLIIQSFKILFHFEHTRVDSIQRTSVNSQSSALSLKFRKSSTSQATKIKLKLFQKHFEILKTEEKNPKTIARALKSTVMENRRTRIKQYPNSHKFTSLCSLAE